ncbi:MAG: ATP-binding protein, partial [Bryobacterales bacterium]|nr:ATP-binding protein [Bryobacterales bacterium]
FGGGAALEVRLEARRVGTRWELAVSDNGRGVDPEDAPRLFRPFRRMQAEDVSGSGFGLAIAMALLTLQDGTLRLDTAYTGGARFVLALPAA